MERRVEMQPSLNFFRSDENKTIPTLAAIIANIPGIRYIWMPLGCLMFRIQYRNACKKGMVLLHVGCGKTHLDGWVNTDIFPFHPYLNVKRRLPIRDNTVSYIFGEHLINYLPRSACLAFFTESFRVLQPDGVLRVATVDIELLARAYLTDPESVRLLNERNRNLGYRYNSYPIDILNKTFLEDGNICQYDSKTIQLLFNEAGFKSIIHCQVGVSSHTVLSGIEQHTVGSILDKFICVIEGTK